MNTLVLIGDAERGAVEYICRVTKKHRDKVLRDALSDGIWKMMKALEHEMLDSFGTIDETEINQILADMVVSREEN